MSAQPALPPGAVLGADRLISLRSVSLVANSAPILAQQPGGFATRRKGHGLEVADVREYAPGDDMRHLDRGATARTGRLFVRQFQEERDRVALLIADFRPSMFWGLTRAFRSVAAAEVLALTGWHLVETGGRVALLAITAEGPVVVPPRPRARGMLDVIAGLVDAHRMGLDAVTRGNDDPPLATALARAERLAPAGAELIIASGFDAPGADLDDRLAALSRRRAVSPILITAADVGRMPAGSYPVRLPGGQRIRVRLGASGVLRPEVERIAGRDALVVDAADPAETTARRLASSSLGYAT